MKPDPWKLAHPAVVAVVMGAAAVVVDTAVVAAATVVAVVAVAAVVVKAAVAAATAAVAAATKLCSCLDIVKDARKKDLQGPFFWVFLTRIFSLKI
jgi:Na+-driven multidrug efflux pump